MQIFGRVLLESLNGKFSEIPFFKNINPDFIFPMFTGANASETEL